jgi:hypothetical protein
MFDINLSVIIAFLLFAIAVGVFYLASIIRVFGIGIGHCYVAQEKNLNRMIEQLKEISAKIGNS